MMAATAAGQDKPPVRIKELHSEYKSTYRWHEFTPKSQDLVVKKAPQPNLDDFLSFSRKKKHPELAYRSHELFDTSLAPPFPTRSSQNSTQDLTDGAGYRSSRRSRFAATSSGGAGSASSSSGPGYQTAAQRRAQSEGPVNRNRHRDASELRPAVPSAARSVMSVAAPVMSTRHGLHTSDMISRGASEGEPSRGDGAGRGRGRGRKKVPGSDDAVSGAPAAMATSFPPPAPSSKWNAQENSLRQIQMKESVSMSQIQTENAQQEEKQQQSRDVALAGYSEPKLMGAVATAERRSRRQYRSEYRVRYRPFSQYEYVDGRFVPSPGASSPTVERSAGQMPPAHSMSSSTRSEKGEPWYKEVVELRKQANDYKCRGWGTDLAPPHINELYHKQMELHEQAKRRESLSALSLAITTPRADGGHPSARDRPDHTGSAPTGVGGSSQSTGTGRATSRASARPSRPGTAPPGAVSSATRGSAAPKSSRSESAHPQHQHDARKKQSGRSVSTSSRPSLPPSARPRSPAKRVSGQQAHGQPPTHASTSASRPSTASSSAPAPSHGASAAGSSSAVDSGGWKAAKNQSINAAAAAAGAHQHHPSKRQRPTSLTTKKQPAPQAQSTSAGDKSLAHQQQARGATAKPSDAAPGASGAAAKRPPLPGTAQPVTSAPSASSVASISASSSRPFSRASSVRTAATSMASREVSRPPSAIENHLVDYFREPVVKSPPEPTRVKSPEGSVRSPDPINWTVPLDTGKTFSVTQSVKDGDSARNSPMSDHSSHFDSVSGTAINLGGWNASNRSDRSASNKISISSLAKEARDLQPGLIKDSTMTRPAMSSSERAAAEAEAQLQKADNVEEKADLEDTEKGQIGTNGATNGAIPDAMTTGIYIPSSSSEANGNTPNSSNGEVLKAVPGTTGLRCLEDPSFLYDADAGLKSSVASAAASAPAAAAHSVPKKPTYRVLEDPFEAEMCAPSSKVAKAAASDAPDQAKVVLGSHPQASEVLEGAREKFDKFWGAKPAGGSGGAGDAPPSASGN